MHWILTYGTLRRDEWNWHRILRNNSEYVGTYQVPGFHLWSNGSYPYAVETEDAAEITTDLFKVDTATFDRIDMLEGYPYHYQRKQVDVPGLVERPWIYHMPLNDICFRLKHLVHIPSGDWKKA